MSRLELPLLLAIDTATSCCSVAVTQGFRHGGSIVGTVTYCGTVTHSRLLIQRIEQLLAEVFLTWEQLSGIAVSIGPGSFTGLRIGMATAKGLAMASGRPLLGVSTLTCLASACSDLRLICTVLDARKNEVYAAFFRRSGDDAPVQLAEAVVITPERLAEGIHEPVYLIGDAVAVYGPYWRERLGKLYSEAPGHLHSPSAAALGMIAAEQLEKGDILDIGSSSPLYVRASDAELNRAAQFR